MNSRYTRTHCTFERAKKISHKFLKIYSFSSVFPPLCCNLAMPRYGKVLTTNLSCSDSELWLGTLKLLGSGGFLFTETFKALWPGPPLELGIYRVYFVNFTKINFCYLM